MLLRRALVALAVLLLASGCNQGAPAPAPSAPAVEAPASGSAGGTAPAPPNAVDPGPGTPVASLFPKQDLALTYRLWDLGADTEATVTQHLLPEAGRLAVIHNGRITATMGTVTFGTDEKGRPVITGVEVTGRCPNG